MDRIAERDQAVSDTIERIRASERDMGVTPRALEVIKGALLALAELPQLFPVEDFPVTAEDGNSVIYRLSEDADHRFALYASVALGGKAVPPTTTPPGR